MNRYLLDNQFLLFVAAIIWLLLLILLSVYNRKKNGKIIIGDPKVNILFRERNASGHSNKNIITKIGGARNSLKVILSDEYLIVTPYFPFNLMFLPNIYDIEFNIDYKDIVEIRKGFMKSINISFKEGTRIKKLNLLLKQKDKFLTTIGTKLSQNIIAV